jgi:hypothetical protein
MNDINIVLRETLDRHAGDVTPSPEFATNIVRRSRQIRHRRMAATSTATAAVVGVTSVATANFVGHQRHGSSGSPGAVKVTTAATGTASPSVSPTPTPTPGFRSPCPDGQAPEVNAVGAVVASGGVQTTGAAETVTQAVLQGYLVDIDNQTPLTAYGVGTDAANGQGVVWVQFKGGSVVEITIDSGHHRWSAYNATLGQCTALGN